MNYLLDTNVLVAFIRGGSFREHIENRYDPFGEQNTAIISVVTVGEIESFALRNGWGIRKLTNLSELLSSLIVTDINVRSVIKKYAEIEAFSQNKLPHKPLPTTARNMGKNDLWIAATAAVIGAKLLTTDTDFEHLNGEYLDLGLVELGKM